MRIVVLSTFDLWPPQDGGQARYNSLWTHFSQSSQVTIIVYDFRNLEGTRSYKLAPNVSVIVPPASRSDANHFFHLLEVTGVWMHDILCISEYSLSNEYMSCLRDNLSKCDAVVASHPYLAGAAFLLAPANAVKVYESHNVELDIKTKHLSNIHAPRSLVYNYLKEVREVERLASEQANHVTVVSSADRQRLIDLYGISGNSISIVPNGVNAKKQSMLSNEERAFMRDHLGLKGRFAAIVIASGYGPNVDSYLRTRQLLNNADYDGVVWLLGSIGSAFSKDWPDVKFEEKVFGYVTEELKEVLLECADFAPHFVFDGAGTNLKLFDYMGSGVAIIANSFGVRGTIGDSWYWAAETAEDVRIAISYLQTNPIEASERREQARKLAIESFDWSVIAVDFEKGLRRGFPLQND